MQIILKNTEWIPRQGAESRGLMGRRRRGLLAMPTVPGMSLSHSVSHQKNLVELSFLPGDTGRPDVFPASLGLPLLKQEERQIEAEERDHKGEKKEQKKNQKRKEKKNQKGQEEAPLPSEEKSEPQKPRARKQGKRPRLESGSEQVCPREDGLHSHEKESVSKAS